MTWDEVFSTIYFGIELYYDGALVASKNVMYSESDHKGINDGVPRVLIYNKDGISITLSVDGSQDSESNVYARNCTITTNERCRVTYKSSLNQVVTMTGNYNYGVTIDSRETSHGAALAVAGTDSYDVRLDLINLWYSCPIEGHYNMGGKAAVYVWPFTHKILRDPATGKIMRGGASNKILRDD